MRIEDLRCRVSCAMRNRFPRNYFFYRTVNDIEISVDEAKRILEENRNTILLDVRTIAEYSEGHISGAIVITDYELEKNILRIIADKNQIILAYCAVGSRSKRAVELLRNLGYINAYSISGGIAGWY